MRNLPAKFTVALIVFISALSPAVAADDLDTFIGAEALAKIKAALPTGRPVRVPERIPRVLVFTESARDLANAANQKGMKFVPHVSAPHCARAVALMGRTGGYLATITSDPDVFSADKLRGFDAIVLANVYLEGKLFKVPRDLKDSDKPKYAARQKALLDFVSSGRGLVGIHNATATALGWGEYNRMIGATHHGHAWHAHQTVPIKLDDPKHPVNAAFGGKGFSIQDDIYTFTSPYSRKNVRVLLSVDTANAPPSMTAERADGDYPVSWVKTHGKGRVFTTSLGHNPATFQNPAFLRHLLDGVLFAMGHFRTTKAPTAPGAPLPAKAGFTTMAGWTPLFDGKDLGAWAVSGSQKAHWLVEDGIIRYDGRAGSLRTKQSFGDYVLRVDWRLPRKADSGVFVRGNKQLNIWTWSMGSGEMWEHRGGFRGPGANPYIPSSCEDRAVGEWNTFLITVKSNRVTVLLNGKKVISDAVLKDKDTSPIGLQQHGDPIEYKSIYIKPLPAAK